jgi:hypothetical protein
MPGTPHSVADHETIGKRTMIVGAMRPDLPLSFSSTRS